jgi:hypothetical protein
MDDRSPPSRARARAARVSAATAFALLTTLGLAACSGGDSDSTAKPTTTLSRATNVDVPLGEVAADSAGPPLNVGTQQAQEILDLLTTYVNDATVQPLRSGAPATADLAMLFDPATLTPATTTDRAVVLDEGLPKVTGTLDVVSTPVALLGLGDQNGGLTLVSAAMVVDTKGQTAVKGDPLHIVRNAEFVVQPTGFGGWRITAYRMVVTRDGAGLSPTTTTTATPATTGAPK